MPDAGTSRTEQELGTASPSSRDALRREGGASEYEGSSDGECSRPSAQDVRLNTSARTYSTVFFDLDGTLLPIDTNQFMKAYMQSIGRFMAERGLDAEAGGQALFAGVMTMGQGHGDVTNHDAFWRVFCERMGKTAEEWEPMFMGYYLNRFDEVGVVAKPNPAAARAVRALKDRRYRLAVTTMPMFPQIAIEKRIQWAGLDPSDFMFMTTYENSTSVKGTVKSFAHFRTAPWPALQYGHSSSSVTSR